MSVSDIEEKFIRTGVFNISEFFKVNQESKNKRVHFDMTLPSFDEWREVEYSKEKEVFDIAWIDSVMKKGAC